ncbi:ABC transporter permease [bacterium]|nr:ABC transporter permease [bacterium]
MTLGLLIKRLFQNPIGILGIFLLLAFTIIALFAPVIAPVDANSYDPQMIPQGGFNRNPQPPSEEHPFGTTGAQYDIFYGVIWGTRTAFRIGIGTALCTTLIGIIIGSLAAYFGGWVDEVLMRITEVFQAFPFLLVAIILTSVLKYVYERGEGGVMIMVMRTLAFATFGIPPSEIIEPNQLTFLFGMIAIIIFGWMEVARVIRGNILSVKNSEYALAARTIGAKNSRILFRHLMPNAIFPLLVVVPMNIGSYVLTYAALSFLGLGVQEGYADWGQMLSLARDWILSLKDHVYIVLYPGAAIVLFVLAWNLVGDALRDILDPRLKGKNTKVLHM